MGEEMLSVRSFGLVLSWIKKDVVSMGEGSGIESLGSLGIVMHPNFAKVMMEARFHEGAGGFW